MANDTESLILSISADVRQMQRALQRMERDTANSTRVVEQRFQRMGQQVEASVRSSFARVNQSISNFGAGFARGIGGALLAGFSVQSVQRYVDAATRIQNALKVAGLEGENLSKVYERLFQSAQKNAVPLETMATLYSRIAQAQDSLGVSQEQIINFTDKIGVALRVAGTSAQEASGALLQLGQALGAGTVRAEEFNSINEGARPILQAVAAGLKEAGGSVAELRKLVLDGKVSSEAFFRAFEAGAETLEEKVKSAETTVSQQFTRLQNVLIDVAGRMDDATGASGRVGAGLEKLAGIIEGLGRVFEAAANGPVGTFIGKLEQLNSLLQQVEPLSRAFGIISDPATLGGLSGLLSGGSASEPTGLSAQIAAKQAELARLEEGLRKYEDAGVRAKVRDLQREIAELQQDLRNAKDKDLLHSGSGRAGASGGRTVANPISLSDYPVDGGTAGASSAASKAGAKAGREYAGAFQQALRRYLVAGQSTSHVDNLSNDFAERLAAFLNAAPGGGISIYSGARSFERQAQLFQEAVAKYGSIEEARKWVAPPGRSQHNMGNAADLRFANDAARQWAHQNAPIYGLNFRMGHEPWHIEIDKASESVTHLADKWEGLRTSVADTSPIQAQTQAFDAFGQVATTALNGLANALADGKIEGRELLQIAIQIVQQFLAMRQAGQGLLGGGGGLGGFAGLLGGAIIPGILHSGGVAGRDGYGHSRLVSPSVFAGARRYHSGGIAGLGAGEVPAILQRGEIVLPKTQPGARSSGTQQIELIVRAEEGEMFRPTVQAAARGEAVKVTRAGIGEYDKQLNGTFGSRMVRAQNRQM